MNADTSRELRHAHALIDQLEEAVLNLRDTVWHQQRRYRNLKAQVTYLEDTLDNIIGTPPHTQKVVIT